ncbi:MAG: pyridoxamine 5'-phosphate oxidase family protein [Roseovarius sp.]
MTDKTDLKTELWQRLDDQRAGMMGIEGTGMHLRPMTPHAEPEANRIWFLCAADNTLAEKKSETGRAHFTLQSPDERFYACVSGAVSVSEDSRKLNELWGVAAEAFFEGGPENSDAVLLELVPDEAEIWTVEASGTQFAAEIARAAAGPKARPDLGTHDVVALP